MTVSPAVLGRVTPGVPRGAAGAGLGAMDALDAVGRARPAGMLVLDVRAVVPGARVALAAGLDARMDALGPARVTAGTDVELWAKGVWAGASTLVDRHVAPTVAVPAPKAVRQAVRVIVHHLACHLIRRGAG